MRSWWRVVALVLLVSACGGGDSDDEVSAGGVVESADGRAALTLEPGSLPEGTSLEDVQLEVLIDETGEPGFPAMAVQLLPDGLVLTELATLTVDLPDALEGGFMAIHTSGDSIEFLDGDIQRDDDGMFTFSTPVGHFSVVSFYEASFFETSVSATPEQVSVGQTQRAVATIEAHTDPISLWLTFGSDPDRTMRQFRFSTTQPPISFESAEINWGRKLPWWDPNVHRIEIAETEPGWTTSSASSICLEDNYLGPMFTSKAKFRLTLLNRGEPVPSAFVGFAKALSKEAVERLSSSSSGSVQLLDMSPGDSFEAAAPLYGSAESACIEAADSATTTLNPTAAPNRLVVMKDLMVEPELVEGGTLTETGAFDAVTPGSTPFGLSIRSYVDENGFVVFYIEGDPDALRRVWIEFDALSKNSALVGETSYLGDLVEGPDWVATVALGQILSVGDYPMGDAALSDRVAAVLTTEISTLDEFVEISIWLYSGLEAGVFDFAHYSLLFEVLLENADDGVVVAAFFSGILTPEGPNPALAWVGADAE